MKQKTYSIIFLCTLLLSSKAYCYSGKREAEKINSLTQQAQEKITYQKYLEDAKNISSNGNKNLNKEASKHKDLSGIVNATLDEVNSLKYQKNLNDIIPNANLEKLTSEYSEKQESQINQLMVFVSSSMPKNSLTQYSIEARKSGAVLVFRGFINNSLKQTVSFIQSLDKEGTRSIVDPLSYERFNIDMVPQIVVIKDNNNCKYGRCETTPLHDKVKGNVSIEKALELISKDGEFSKNEATRFLNQLRTHKQL